MEKLAFARSLRRELTAAEQKLWARLRDRRLEGWKFRRQRPIGKYVADFVCAEAMLVVEVDGQEHSRRREEDALRTAFLETCGYRVLRVTNTEVAAHIEGVLAKIKGALGDAQTSPPRGGEVDSP